jgi:hypothetical protein
MEDVTRKRVLRRLEALPEEQLYQVLDFIEFLEAKYARLAARKPDAFQQFAERVEDQMRVRSLAPRAMRGTMKIMSTAGKVLDGVRDLGRGLMVPEERSTARARGRPAAPAVRRADSTAAPSATSGAPTSPPSSPAPSPAPSPTSFPAPETPGGDARRSTARGTPEGPGPA